MKNYEMERLDFTIPEWTRTIWVSREAESAYANIISRVSTAVVDLERLAVAEGVRPSSLQYVHPEGMERVSEQAAKRGLVVLPLSRNNRTGGYQASTTQFDPKIPWHYRVAITRPEFASDWYSAWNSSNDPAIGKLLGYPSCCREFFQDVWIDQKFIDTTWPMFVASDRNALGPPEVNILLRWLGIRLVSHLPCSFRCRKSYKIGLETYEIGLKHGYQKEVEFIREALGWAVEWSALHGIAEIKLPILKVSTRTDPTPTKYVVRREGTTPVGSAKGINFPYQNKQMVQLTKSKSFRRSVAVEDDWKDNGFPSQSAMEDAHNVILKALGSVSGTVLDLGCGNGELLRRIKEKNDVKVFGIDIEEQRVKRAKQRIPDGTFFTGDLFSTPELWNRSYSCVIFMPGRLAERFQENHSDWVEQYLKPNSSRVLLYAYGDWVTKYGSLAEICRAVGLTTNLKLSYEGSYHAAKVRSKEILATDKDCGCGGRATKLIRRMGISEEEMSTEYIEDHHAKATIEAVGLKLRGKV